MNIGTKRVNIRRVGTMTGLLLGIAALALVTAARDQARAAGEAGGAVAVLRTVAGESVGVVAFAPQGGQVLVQATVWRLPPGFHGFHIHAVGSCDPATSFASAGGHLNSDGHAHAGHAGDQPPLLVLEDGAGQLTFRTDRYALAELLDADGSAVIVHALPDNFANIPERYAPNGPDETTRATGDAGGRIACGVIE